MHSFYTTLLNVAAILNSYLVVAEIPTFMGVSDNIVGHEHRKCAFAMHPMALKQKKNHCIAQSDMSQSCLQFLFAGQQEVETLRNRSEINNKMEFDININLLPGNKNLGNPLKENLGACGGLNIQWRSEVIVTVGTVYRLPVYAISEGCFEGNYSNFGTKSRMYRLLLARKNPTSNWIMMMNS